LLSILDRARERGYAVSDQENVTGLRVLAAPVFDADGTPIAGLSAAAPAFNGPLAAFEDAARGPVMAAAKALSRALQASGG
jgi:IclR family pca regulon transcriptional regulator